MVLAADALAHREHVRGVAVKLRAERVDFPHDPIEVAAIGGASRTSD
jgi:hypothetical protein